MSAQEGRTDRRELFRSIARGAALLVLGAGAAALSLRNAGPGDCGRQGPCAACSLREACDRRPGPPEWPQPGGK